MSPRTFRSNSPPSRRAQKRDSLWLFLTPEENTIVTTGATQIGTLNSAALALRPFTIVRTRISAYIRSDQTASAEEQQIGFGVCVVSDQATAIGITAIPTPVTDLGSDEWLMIQLMFSAVNAASGAGSIVPNGRGFEIDSKAMRKVDNSSDMNLVLEGGAQNDGAIVTTGGRILVKLH